MNYRERLKKSVEKSGSLVCMGLDPVPEALPDRGTFGESVISFYSEILETLVKRSLSPGAFKPNIGYFHCHDAPRSGSFEGSLTLARLLDIVEELFPEIPVIVDSKRGDIARSSENYADEAFNCWNGAAVTVSPYMGTDSVEPFFRIGGEGRGVYILNRTSNPGAADLQSSSSKPDGFPLFMKVASKIAEWGSQYSGIGAVVGATNTEELGMLASFYAEKEIPLLIPGVGKQGGSFEGTLQELTKSGYPLALVRINLSSGLTHPWGKTPPPEDGVRIIADTLCRLNETTGL